MEGKKRVIILVDYPFNKRDYDRYGIETIRNHGISVEIWDITPILHKEYTDQLKREDPNKFPGLNVFEEKNEFINLLPTLDSQCLVNCMIEYSTRTYFIFRMFTKYKIDYCVFEIITYPIAPSLYENPIKRFISRLGKGDRIKIDEIIQHVCNRILLHYYFLWGISPPTFVIQGGEKSSESRLYPVGKNTARLWTHYMDYDIFLEEKAKSPASKKKTGVFLDQYLPLHPDFLHMGIDFPLSPEEYYPKLCNFFEILEKQLDVEIVIAAHPRSDYGHQPDYFCGRAIVKGDAARLVRESSFVMAHSTTSIDFAVLFNKPILFLTTDDLDRMDSGKNIVGLDIRTIAGELGKKPINIDHLSGFDGKKETAFDKEVYARYINLYIKKQGTPEKPVWEIFCDYIQNGSS